MEYISIPVKDLDAPEFVCATPVDKATWLCLQHFCCGQENDGLIIGAASWSDRKWRGVVRVTLREIMSKTTELWTWEGDNLRVWRYRVDQQEYWKARRAASQANGKLGGRPAKKPENNQCENPSGTKPETQKKPSSKPRLQQENPSITQPETQTKPRKENKKPEKNNKQEKEYNKEEKEEEIKERKGTNPSVSPPTKQADSKSRCTHAEAVSFFLEQGLGPPWLEQSLAENEASKFVDFYESKGWRVGSAPMRDWRASARNWIRKWQESPQAQKLRAPNSPPPAFDPTAPNAHTGGLADAGAD